MEWHLLIIQSRCWKQAELRCIYVGWMWMFHRILAGLTLQWQPKEVTWIIGCKTNRWERRFSKAKKIALVERVQYLIETQRQGDGADVMILLDSLQQADIKMGLATNSTQSIIPSVLQALDIADYLWLHIQHKKWSKETGPRVYQLTLGKNSTFNAGQCRAFEDSLGAIKRPH